MQPEEGEVNVLVTGFACRSCGFRLLVSDEEVSRRIVNCFREGRDCSIGVDLEKRDPRWRWWGNVRVASYPQAGNQALADLATGLATQLGSVKFNQLAQGAEFLTGLECDFLSSRAFRGFGENTRQRFHLGFIAAFGATGFFDAPSKNVQVFQVPSSGSPQLAVFNQTFPGVTTANVGFLSPDIERRTPRPSTPP